ncbi:type IX secretion system protein PorQ [Flavobacterium psychrotrophum]|uniref:type IX secretion system protein PorQ n=1 Tax=Flavobacterium psychrotrophum TaxID=2294119 RepID=UPI000E31F3F0|nr:type IX secretion system protein PorQ [Flavobacterium psychrotrophum]
MFKNRYLLIFLLAATASFGQIGGKYTYQFLNLVTSPRQAALGGKLVTLYDYDVNQAIYNPATINPEMSNQLSANYGSYFGEVTYGTAAYAYTYDRHVQTFHMGVNYVNYGDFEGYDEMGTKTGTFSGSEIALSFGYAYNIPYTDIHIGANAKLISSTLESYNSIGAAVDIGGIYIDEDNDINIGLAVRNIGTQLTTYAGTNEPLPLEVIAGISQEVENVPIRWHVTLENLQQWNIAFSNPNRATEDLEGNVTKEKVSFFNNALRHVILGAELFPGKSFNIRAGYNFRRSAELSITDKRSFSGISAGFSVRFNKLRFDYSYSRYTLAASTSLFGVMINLQ